LLNELKKSWKALKKERPGNRFQARYHHVQQSGSRRNRVLKLGAGIALTLAGVVLLLVPGPGSLLIAVGGAFLAEESLIAARLLDRLEVLLRKVFSAAKTKWRQFSTAQRLSCAGLFAALVGGAAWGAWSLLWR
jgi:hypothetical protein